VAAAELAVVAAEELAVAGGGNQSPRWSDQQAAEKRAEAIFSQPAN
jgi:hypothetical protein